MFFLVYIQTGTNIIIQNVSLYTYIKVKLNNKKKIKTLISRINKYLVINRIVEK